MEFMYVTAITYMLCNI